MSAARQQGREAPEGRPEAQDIIREWTLALVQVGKVGQDLLAILSGHGDMPGLLHNVAALNDSVSSLEEKVVGVHFLLSRVNHILDRVAEIRSGDPDADPPVAGRDPTLADVGDAIAEFDAEVEREAEEAEEGESGEDGPILSNMPPLPSPSQELPPLPVFRKGEEEKEEEESL